MREIAIQVEGLGKQYRLGQRERYKALRDVLANPFRRSPKAETIWALRDVGFTVEQGEVIGIIGRNGAGKSTLLKILSQITEPTEGRAEIHGRVGSLLEVGTGFHPELTGRENIFLNGAILGMRKHEIAHKFDEIVAFAEVEKFIDTPVKHYSSGMQMRLAFAVAAHLEPEILLVDEVLAVGDAVFQKKCMGKMSDVAKQGRTVLFVSHNMGAIRALCERTVLLNAGKIWMDGKTDEVVGRYLAVDHDAVADGRIPDNCPRVGNGEARIRQVGLTDLGEDPVRTFCMDQPFRVSMAFDLHADTSDLLFEVGVVTLDGTQILQTFSTDGGRLPCALVKGHHKLTVDVHTVLLPRSYSLLVGIHHASTGVTMDFVERTIDFSTVNVDVKGIDQYRWTTRGYVRPNTQWHVPGPNGRST